MITSLSWWLLLVKNQWKFAKLPIFKSISWFCLIINNYFRFLFSSVPKDSEFCCLADNGGQNSQYKNWGIFSFISSILRVVKMKCKWTQTALSKIFKPFFPSLLDLIVLCLCAVAFATPSAEEPQEIEAAQFHFMNSPYNFNPNNFNQYNKGQGQVNYGHQGQYPQDLPVFDNGPLNPGKYLDMDDDEFPVDYSLSCSNSCGCRQTCMIVWWQPCTCRCPPPCGCNGCSWGCCGNRCCKQ